MKYILLFAIFFSIDSWIVASEKLQTVSKVSSPSFQEYFKTDDVIWGFDFLDDQDMILTLKEGKILRLNLKTKKTTEIKHSLKISNYGQGGLMDVAKDTDFKNSKLIFLTYSKQDGKKDRWTTELVQAELDNVELKNIKVLATANARSDNKIHFGSRIVVKDDMIYITVGDRNERDLAQDAKVDNGKVITVNRKNLEKSVYTKGHRNPQGLVRHPETGDLWLSEHGPRGGDEINLLVQGKNYGWPIVTFGKEYWGPSISDFSSKAGFEDPIHQMTPSIAPSAIMIYSGKKYPELTGQVFLSALALKHIAVFKIENKKVTSQSRWVENLNERIRNIKESPSGDIVFSTDSGKIFWSQ